MGDTGSPHARFQRAVDRRNLLAAEASARELGLLSLADALDLLLLIAEKPERFERAAVRWLARFALEVRGLRLSDTQLALGALANLRDPVPTLALETLALLADRFRVGSVTRAARRRLHGR